MVRNTWAECPLCGAGIKRACLKYGKPFPCPECQRLLVAPLHTVPAALIGGAASGSLAYMFGARGLWLVLITWALLIPGLFACAFFWTLFVPPSLKPLTSHSAGQAGHPATGISEGDADETFGAQVQNSQTKPES